jgi:hypothetical protein
MLAFGPADIARVIEPATLARGRAVRANGQVIDVDINDAGTVIVGRVRGSEPRPYLQMITLRPGKSGIVIHGTCSCPVHSNCKHVAAVLIEVERRASPIVAALALPARGRPDDGTQSRSLSPQLQLWLGDLDEVCAPGVRRQRLLPRYQAAPHLHARGGARPQRIPLARTHQPDGGEPAEKR